MPGFDAEYEPSPRDRIEQEVERYERSNGSEPSVLVGDQWVILWTVGARSGKVRKTPLVRVTDGQGRYAVVGSQGGKPMDPGWVHNLRSTPQARIQDGAIVHDLVVREIDGAEKVDWWSRATAVWPAYDEYQAATSRIIPVFVLAPAT
jgi:deazaflavin-dependent oxidoreductase (nitroreductase family)